MAFGQRKICIPGQGAEPAQVRRQAVAQQSGMPGTADLVGEDANRFQFGFVRQQAGGECAEGLRHAACIDC